MDFMYLIRNFFKQTNCWRKKEMHTNTGNTGEEILLCAELNLWLSNMRKAERALERLTHNFPRNRITSPITFTLPIRRMLLMIYSVAIAEALQKLLPVIAICKSHKPTIRKHMCIHYRTKIIMASAYIYQKKLWLQHIYCEKF